MKIQPISFEKKYKKPRTGKREMQKTQTSVQKQQMSAEASKAMLVKQADYALIKASKIKQSANSAKMRSFEVLDKAKKQAQFANGLYSVILSNSTDKDVFVVQYEGMTYKVEKIDAKYRAIGQSRGFFGKKDVFEYEIKKDGLKTSILRGYEKDLDSYKANEEYHITKNSAIDVFFNASTDKNNKKYKEGFSFYDDKLSMYHTNAKTFLNDFSYGEFGSSFSFDTLFGNFSNCNIGLECSKNAFAIKESYHFMDGKLNSYIKDCKARARGENSDCINGVMIQYGGNKAQVGYINYHVVNEKPSFDFVYEFQPQPAFS